MVQLTYEGEGRVIATEPSSREIRELHKVPHLLSHLQAKCK